jgi:tRNA threonylcarbamoyladenosine biosynthesis protein TsaE
VSAAHTLTLRELELADETATAALAAALAGLARRGDVIALRGELGSGKTSFARAFIRARGRGDEEVPSPTFTLVEIYDAADARALIWHFDLYRLERPEEAYELGIEEALAEGISLIEWPERLGGLLPAARLDLSLMAGAAPDARRVRLAASPDWDARLATLRHD